MILILNYRRQEKGICKKSKSLVKCDTCGLEREVYRYDVLRGKGDKICKTCARKINMSVCLKKRPAQISFKAKTNIANANRKRWSVSLIDKMNAAKKKLRENGKRNWNWIEDREEAKKRVKCAMLGKQLINNTLKNRVRENGKTFQQLGYTCQTLRKHLESLWEPWMNWENYGTSRQYKEGKRTWQIDHIKSVNSYNKEGIFDLKIINNLLNLRPLDTMENLKRRVY